MKKVTAHAVEAAWGGWGICLALNARRGQIISSAGSFEPRLNLYVGVGGLVVVSK